MKTTRPHTAMAIVPVMLLCGFGFLLMNSISAEGSPQGSDPVPRRKAPSDNSAQSSRQPESSAANTSSRRTNLANQVEQALSNGDAQLEAKHYVQAEKSYRRAMVLNPKDFRAYCGLGDVYYRQDRGVDAVQAYSKCSRDDPVYAYNGLGNAYFAQQRYPEAIEQYNKTLKLDPKGAYVHYNLGSAYYRQHRYPEAIEQYNKAISLDSKYTRGYVGLGDVYSAQERYPEAIEQYKKAIRANPKYAPAYTDLGIALRNQKNYVEAEAALRAAARLDPSDGSVYFHLGYLFGAQQKYSEAEAAYREALRLNPSDAASHNNLGVALETEKRLTAAEAEYREAVRLVPTDKLYNKNLKSILDAQGKSVSLVYVTVAGNNTGNGWTNSGLVVHPGQHLRIYASGKVGLGNGRFSTPDGLISLPDRNKLMQNQPTGGLVAVIGGDNDDFIFIGRDRDFLAQREDVLYLGVNEGNLTDNSGNFDVVIETEAPRTNPTAPSLQQTTTSTSFGSLRKQRFGYGLKIRAAIKRQSKAEKSRQVRCTDLCSSRSSVEPPSNRA